MHFFARARPDCGGAGPYTSGLQYVVQDAQAAAELGFSSIKIDGCGPSSNISAWAAALNATGKKILLEDCLTKQYAPEWIFRSLSARSDRNS